MLNITWDPYAEFEMAVLPNGLTIHAAHWPKRPWEAMGFLVHSGAEQDPIELEGLAHFVEHLVSNNTVMTNKEIGDFFHNCGGMVNFGSTSYMATKYKFFAPIDENIIMKALSIFGQMLFSAKLENFVERERQVIIGEFRRKYKFECEFELAMRRQKMLYKGCWLERSTMPLGNLKSIERITQNNIQSFYDKYYTPANMSIVAVGGMKLNELITAVSASPFVSNKNGIRTPLPTKTQGAISPIENRYIFELSKYVTDVSSLKTASYESSAKIPNATINIAVLDIVCYMLDEILTDEIREHQGWTYDIGVSYYNLRHFYELMIDCGSFSMSAIDKIEITIEECIISTSEREDLFKKIKRRIVAKKALIDQTASEICDNAMHELANYYEIKSNASDCADIEKTTMDDVRNLLKWLAPERRWTRIIRP